MRTLLNARACGERVQIDVEFMVVIFAVAAKKCLVAFRPEYVVLRSVILFVPFCIERDYDDKRPTSLVHVEVLDIKFLVYLARGSWSCVYT